MPRVEHAALMRRDFLSYLIAGNLWPYGHLTAVTIQGILITTPKVLDFEDAVVQAEERGHHDAALQKIHDYVWQLIERYGEEPIRKRIAEIDAAVAERRSPHRLRSAAARLPAEVLRLRRARTPASSTSGASTCT